MENVNVLNPRMCRYCPGETSKFFDNNGSIYMYIVVKKKIAVNCAKLMAYCTMLFTTGLPGQKKYM